MAASRIPGPLCDDPCRKVDVPLDQFHPPGASYVAAGPIEAWRLAPEQEKLALDLIQLTLDVVGVFDPTPFADGTSALISLGRGDLLGAGVSGLGILPYIGDLAKAGKLSKYSETLYAVNALARRDAEFAKRVRPVLMKLKSAIDSLPDGLSPQLLSWVNAIKQPLDSYLGGTRAAKRLDDLESLTDRLLLARLGSLKNVSVLVRENVKVCAEFFRDQGLPDAQMLSRLSGIDLHSPVRRGLLNPGDVVIQYVDESLGMGAWFVRAGSGGGANIGLAKGNRVAQHFKITRSVEFLESRATAVIDTWTPHAVSESTNALVRKPGSRIVLNSSGEIDIATGGARLEKAPLDNAVGVGTHGGGQQLYLGLLKKSGDRWVFDEQRFRQAAEKFVPGRTK